VDAIFAGSASTPLSRVLADVARSYALRREDFLAVIDGMEMDAAADIRAPSLAELDLYCDRVASAVGRLSVRIFGCDLPAADRVAWALGRALQLTNILRDLAEDAERGRLYLPREYLVDAGIAETEPEAVLRHAAVMRAVYHAILLRLRRRGWREPAQEVKLPTALKLWLALRHGLL